MPAAFWGQPQRKGRRSEDEALHAVMVDTLLARQGGPEGLPSVMLRKGMRFFAVQHHRGGVLWLRLCEQSVSLAFTSMSLGGLEVTEKDDLWVQAEGWKIRQVPDETFAAGEAAEVLITEGVAAGSFAPCIVERDGAVPGTYDIEVPQADQLFNDVPPEYLRKRAEL
eukprot:TRINITY_DN82480_c0_g1_i1.p1 TRINITY_DN82480_c0_g1~~TRINITY_DN82480_c0_g1_i1.p1  ORF type:complete len:167 (-),score=35.48 TRINITY_DN82480_c0_g1_i1:18-518(-)